MKHVLICADDYAIAPGVSRAIRQLVVEHRINATSVMTVAEPLAGEAAALLHAAEGRGTSIGLHVTLTGRFVPLTRGMMRGEGYFPSLSRLMAEAFSGRLSPRAVAAEVEAQFAAFEQAFGRPPDHVDGHQHAHVLPVVRRIVLDTTRRRAPGALVRDCTPAPGALRGFDLKGRLIGALSRGLARDAARRGLRTNTGFAGAYDFGADHDFARLIGHFVAGLPDGGLVMVHPGKVDDPLVARDVVTQQREVEFGVLAGAEFPRLLAEAGASL